MSEPDNIHVLSAPYDRKTGQYTCVKCGLQFGWITDLEYHNRVWHGIIVEEIYRSIDEEIKNGENNPLPREEIAHKESKPP